MTLHEVMTADNEDFLRIAVELGWFAQLTLDRGGDFDVTEEFWGFLSAMKDEYERRWPNPGADGQGFEALEATLEIVERFVRT